MIRQSVDIPTRLVRIGKRDYSITRRGKFYDIDGFESMLPANTTFGFGTVESEFNRGRKEHK